MPTRDLQSLEQSEISLSVAAFAVNLGLFFVSSIILHSETPYSLINVSKAIFNLIWITSGATCGCSLSALIIFLYARITFVNSPRQGRIVQFVGLIFFLIAIICFIISFSGLVWGYADTDELLQFSNMSQKIATFMFLLSTITFGLIFVIIHWIASYFCCQNRYSRSDVADPFD